MKTKLNLLAAGVLVLAAADSVGGAVRYVGANSATPEISTAATT